MMASAWWVWVLAGLGLAVLEIVVPAYIFLGFAIGAVATGLILWVGGPLAAMLAGSWPLTLLVFALLSGAAWLGLRQWLGVRRGQAKIWDRDINED